MDSNDYFAYTDILYPTQLYIMFKIEFMEKI